MPPCDTLEGVQEETRPCEEQDECPYQPLGSHKIWDLCLVYTLGFF